MNQYYVGVDFAAKLKWWQRVIVWLGFRNRWNDKSCMVTYQRHSDGTIEVVDTNYF